MIILISCRLTNRKLSLDFYKSVSCAGLQWNIPVGDEKYWCFMGAGHLTLIDKLLKRLTGLQGVFG